MKALVTLSGRFERGRDGQVYPQNPALTYERFFNRYLGAFEEVLVAARVRPLAREPDCPQPSNGPRVSFVDLPTFSGFGGLAFSIPKIRRRLQPAIKATQAYFLRVPCLLGTLARKEIRRLRLPYAVEVVGDPADSLQAGSFQHPLRPFMRWLSIHQLKVQCAEAIAAAYVSECTLQRRYPPNKQAFTTNYSSIDLPSVWFTPKPRQFYRPASRLVFVGTLEVLYKAPDVILEALKILSERGIFLNLSIVGDGRCRPQLESRVKELGIGKQVVFYGKVPYHDIITYLDNGEIFLLPSKQEGLPKAMIEAMARGLPCIGSTAGGIPELLPPEDFVPPGDAVALADKINEVAGNPERMTHMSGRNLLEAQKYRSDVLRIRRLEFYGYVRETSGKWLKM